MGAHIINGQFQSDKYPTCPPGKVPLSVKDETAQNLLWEYAQRRRRVDAEFADDLETALKAAGFEPPTEIPGVRDAIWESWGELGSLDLQVGDVIDEEDVRLYQAHVKAIGRAVDALGMKRR